MNPLTPSNLRHEQDWYQQTKISLGFKPLIRNYELSKDQRWEFTHLCARERARTRAHTHTHEDTDTLTQAHMRTGASTHAQSLAFRLLPYFPVPLGVEDSVLQ